MLSSSRIGDEVLKRSGQSPKMSVRVRNVNRSIIIANANGIMARSAAAAAKDFIFGWSDCFGLSATQPQ